MLYFTSPWLFLYLPRRYHSRCYLIKSFILRHMPQAISDGHHDKWQKAQICLKHIYKVNFLSIFLKCLLISLRIQGGIFLPKPTSRTSYFCCSPRHPVRARGGLWQLLAKVSHLLPPFGTNCHHHHQTHTTSPYSCSIVLIIMSEIVTIYWSLLCAKHLTALSLPLNEKSHCSRGC